MRGRQAARRSPARSLRFFLPCPVLAQMTVRGRLQDPGPRPPGPIERADAFGTELGRASRRFDHDWADGAKLDDRSRRQRQLELVTLVSRQEVVLAASRLDRAPYGVGVQRG